jgi:Family of unknown function (DUF5759)
MDEIRHEKLNLDELYEQNKQSCILTVKSYNIVLTRIHQRIKTASKQRINNKCCWFVVPEILIGVPKYDVRPCIAYLIKELTENGFDVKYTHPNLLFISWAGWIPDYVRHELKKQTGTLIDGFGKEVKVDKKESKYKSVDTYKPTGKFAYSEELFQKIISKTDS